MTTSICALVPTYNRASMLRECIDSILAQTRPVQEIIVINDGSTDNTKEVVASFGNRVTLIDKENGGKSTALNMGLQQCKSDYVWVCDDDDIAVNDGIEALATALDQNPDVDIAFGSYKIFYDNDKNRVYSDPVYRPRDSEPSIKLRFLEGMFTNQFATLVRRSLYKKVGPFREDLIRSQDYDMAIRLSRHAKAIAVPKTIFYYRQHQAVRGSAKDAFSSAAMREKWVLYDEKILTKVRQEYDLKEFVPSFASHWPSAKADRAAFLERACICADHVLWKEAVSDVGLACQENHNLPEPGEITLAESIIRHPLTWEKLSRSPEWMTKLRIIYEMNLYGQHIVFAICRPLVWLVRGELKKGNLVSAMRFLKIMWTLLGTAGTTKRFLSSALK